ncbi:MAG: glycosyltransferase family 1 protein [bacterium]|nr:glycosyltransferase family 1 protein [bacterium]
MRIGYDASGILGHGGIDRYARELMRYTVALDTKNTYAVLTRKSCAHAIREIVAGGHNVDVRAVLPHDMLLGPILEPITRQIQKRVWRKTMSDVDLVHLTSQWRWLPPVNKFIVTVHDLFPLTMDDIGDARRRVKFKRYLDTLVHRASMLLTPSHFVAETIVERYPHLASHIRITPLAAGNEFKPTPATNELRERAGITSESRYLLFIGRVDDRKNIERMLRAFLSIPESTRANTLFVLGLSGLREDIAAFKQRNERMLRSAAIKTVYSLTTTDIVMLMSEARAFVFASLAEGFGLPVVEAMRCGCPVLTSSLSSLPEVAGNAALLVDPYDEEAIRDAMMRLLEDDALVEDLRVRGLERGKQFSWENTARLTLRAYEEAMV